MHLLFFLVTWTVDTKECLSLSHLAHAGHHAAHGGGGDGHSVVDPAGGAGDL